MLTIKVNKIPETNVCKDFESGITCKYLDESLAPTTLMESAKCCKLFNALSTVEHIDYEVYKLNSFINCSYCSSKEWRFL